MAWVWRARVIMCWDFLLAVNNCTRSHTQTLLPMFHVPQKTESSKMVPDVLELGFRVISDSGTSSCWAGLL